METLPENLSITFNTRKPTINICPVTLPNVSPGRVGKTTNGFLVTLPVVSGSVTTNSLSWHIRHFYIGGPNCCVARGSRFALFSFFYSFGVFWVPVVSLWAVFGVICCTVFLLWVPFESFALPLVEFRVPLGPVLFFLHCVSNRISFKLSKIQGYFLVKLL